MANEEHLQRLKLDMRAWNAWRQEHFNIQIDLKNADLKNANLEYADLENANLTNANLRGAHLEYARLMGADLSEADLSTANLTNANLTNADLRGAHLEYADLDNANLEYADLEHADLSGANLSGAHLSGANFTNAFLEHAKLSAADLSNADFENAELNYADLSDADLSGAHLSGAHLMNAFLMGAHLRGADLMQGNLIGLNLIKADLTGADLTGASLENTDLFQANFSRANLSGADLSAANLIDANLDGATLTDACLWEIQRAGWSIQGIICEAVYWDKAMVDRITYSPGEFERFYAETTKIVLHYEGGISPIEIATLPALIQRMESAHPGCVLRLHSVEDAPGGATVSLVIDNDGECNPDELEALKADIKTFQIALREERGIREEIEFELQILYNKILPRIVGHTTVYGELTMGDKFENIKNTTIVNRSLVEQSFNKVKRDFDEETAEALKKVAEEIERSHNKEAAENFDSFNEELQKPEPKRTVLRTLWSGVTTALPAITQMTDVVTKITNLLGS